MELMVQQESMIQDLNLFQHLQKMDILTHL